MHDEYLSGISREVFEWKYEPLKRAGSKKYVVAEKGGRIIGGVGNFGVPLEMGGRKFKAMQPTDIMLDKNSRNIHTFHKMVVKLRDHFGDASLVEYGFPSGETRNLWRSAEDWSFCNYQLRIIPNTLSEVIPSRRNRLKSLFALLNIPYKIITATKDLVNKYKGFGVPVHSCLGYLPSIFEPGTQSRRVRIQRDPEFWLWRLSDPRITARTYCLPKSHPINAGLLFVSDHAGKGSVALQSTPRNAREKKALNRVYLHAIMENRHLDVLEVPSQILSCMSNKVRFGKFLVVLAHSDLAKIVSKLIGINISQHAASITNRYVGWKWYDKCTSNTKPSPLQWEMSNLLRDW